jgi:hypothetical protein
MAAKVGTARILYRAGTISLQAAVHPKYTHGALNMKEEESNVKCDSHLHFTSVNVV